VYTLKKINQIGFCSTFEEQLNNKRPLYKLSFVIFVEISFLVFMLFIALAERKDVPVVFKSISFVGSDNGSRY